MSKYIYTATCPDGTIVTRKTDRIYTHAVVGYWRDEEIPTYGMFEFCGRLDLAQKSYKKWTARGAKVVVVPVDNPRPEPTDTLAEVDMGGDFEGFIEAVNAPQVEHTAQVWYTEPVTSADGEQIRARVTVRPELGDFLIEVLANGMALVNETETIYGGEGLAIAMANAMVFIYAHKLDKEVIEEPKPETPRIKQLRNRIASQERELIDLRFELSQLLGGK